MPHPLEILENVGLLVRNERARTIFKQHGCYVDSETQIVEFQPSVVENFRSMLPPTFTFYGRESKYDRTLPQDGPIIVTGSSAPDIIDPVTSQIRGRALMILHASPTLFKSYPVTMFSLFPRWPKMQNRDISH